jgi:hypothetical protein
MDAAYCRDKAREAEELARQMSSNAARVAMLAQAQRWLDRAKLLDIVNSRGPTTTPSQG